MSEEELRSFYIQVNRGPKRKRAKFMVTQRVSGRWSDSQTTTSPTVVTDAPGSMTSGAALPTQPGPLSLPLACKVNKHLCKISCIHLEVPPIFNLAAFAELSYAR